MAAIANKGQKGIVTLNAGPSPIRIYVWSALEIVRDPYSGAGRWQGDVDRDGVGLRGLHSAHDQPSQRDPSEAGRVEDDGLKATGLAGLFVRQ